MLLRFSAFLCVYTRAPGCHMRPRHYWNTSLWISLNCMHIWGEIDQLSSQLWGQFASCPDGRLSPAVSCGFMARDRNVFRAICCVWPLRWWSTGRVTPGRICSKSSLVVMGGPEPGSMLWDWSAPYSKAKYWNLARGEGHAARGAFFCFEALSNT